MATNPPPRRPTTNEVRAARSQVRNLMRHPSQHPSRQEHPSNGVPDLPMPVIHYALDLESPPLIACEAPEPGVISSPTASEVTCPDCMTHEEFPRAVLVPKITGRAVLMEAASLLSETGENPEYDRAIVELTSALIGAGPDDDILMTRILRALAQGE